ncbi:hypothetical protein HQ531_10845 [bacterium]|nr:hypothetical protein [bacterium]
MTTEHDQKDAKEQLAFIRSIMDDSQKVLADNGDGFIVWGILILLAGLSSHIFQAFNLQQFIGWMYLIFVGLGWIYMITLHKKAEKYAIGNPMTKKIIEAIWTAVLISMTILGFVGAASGTIDLEHLTAVLYTALGTAYYLQGIITGKAWVRNLGFGWWLGSVILYFISGPAAGILAAAMMIGLQIVPGFIFNHQWKAQLSED